MAILVFLLAKSHRSKIDLKSKFIEGIDLKIEDEKLVQQLDIKYKNLIAEYCSLSDKSNILMQSTENLKKDERKHSDILTELQRLLF